MSLPESDGPLHPALRRDSAPEMTDGLLPIESDWTILRQNLNENPYAINPERSNPNRVGRSPGERRWLRRTGGI